jgi:hypothetical protein
VLGKPQRLKIGKKLLAQRRKDAKFGEFKNILNFAPWRLGAINFLAVVLFNISEVSA